MDLAKSQRFLSKPLILIIALVLILLLALGIGLVVIIGCTGFGLMGFFAISKDLPAAQASAESFLDDVKQGRTEAAYAKTTADFRRSQTPQQFADFVNRFAILKSHNSKSSEGARIHHGPSGKQAILKFSMFTPDNAMSSTLTLLHEEGEWRVQRFTIP